MQILLRNGSFGKTIAYLTCDQKLYRNYYFLLADISNLKLESRRFIDLQLIIW